MSLDVARTAAYEPASNLRAEQPLPTALYLLDRLDLDRAVMVGSPSPGTVAAVEALARSVVQRPPAADGEAGWRAQLPADLLYLGADALRELATSAPALAALAEQLEAGGAVYLEPSALAVTVAARFGTEVAVRVEPAADDEPPRADFGPLVRAAPTAAWVLPVAADRPAGVLRRARARVPLLRRSPPAGAVTLAVAGVEPLRAGAPDPQVAREVLVRPLPASPLRPPGYLLDVARAAGHPLEDRTWSLIPARGYRSQKLVFFLAGPGEEAEVVKLTQDERFNWRLENEVRSLRALADEGLDGVVGAPRVLFDGQHAGLYLAGQSRLAGRPFRAVSTGRADCPVAHAAIESLTALGRASAHSDQRGGAPAGEALAALLGSYRDLYRPAPEEARLLDGAVTALADAGPALPMVFQHGDPTTLNLLVGEAGEIRMVDWENGELSAPPLWDLMYFLQAYGAWAAARRRRRFTPEALRQDLLTPSGLGGMPAAAIASYRAAVGVPAELLWPLVTTCWMYLALRQARQLPADRLRRGFYARVLEVLARRPLPGTTLEAWSG